MVRTNQAHRMSYDGSNVDDQPRDERLNQRRFFNRVEFDLDNVGSSLVSSPTNMQSNLSSSSNQTTQPIQQTQSTPCSSNDNDLNVQEDKQNDLNDQTNQNNQNNQNNQTGQTDNTNKKRKLSEQDCKFDARRSLVDLVISNYSLILFNDSMIDKEKSELIKENGGLINLLKGFNKRMCSSSNRTGEDDLVIDNLLTKSKSEDKIYDLVKELDEKIKKMEENRNELSFNLEIKDVDQFLSVETTIRSESFPCLSIHWCMEAKSKFEFNNVKYILIFLWSNSEDHDSNWMTKVDYELKLFSCSDDLQSKSWLKQDQLFSKEQPCTSCLISYDDLNRYINNNTIKLGIQMTANRVIKRLDR